MDFINKCLDFLSLELFDISCKSYHVLPISKPLSVVFAECGHFVVTWSVQEYSCGHLCRNMPAEPEPFDICVCSCMSYLVGYLKPDLCKS